MGQNANGTWVKSGGIWDILKVEPSGLQVYGGREKG